MLSDPATLTKTSCRQKKYHTMNGNKTLKNTFNHAIDGRTLEGRRITTKCFYSHALSFANLFTNQAFD